MLKNYFEKTKNSKLFMRFDIFIYIFISLLFVFLLLYFTVFNKNENNAGFKIIIDDKTAFTFQYDLGINGLKVNDSLYNEQYEIKQEKNTILLKVFVDKQKTEYNLLKIDCQNKTVKIQDANCSLHKDCVYFAPLENNNGSIICLPHKLIILPLSSDFFEPVIG